MKNSKKMNNNGTDKLLKLLESKIDKLVEQRVLKLLPMLVEHEVNRLLREETKKENKLKQPHPVKREPVNLQNGNITESLRQLVGDDMNEWRTMSYNTQTGIPTQSNLPMTTMEGRPVDTSNSAVQGILGVLNGDLGAKFKQMDKLSKQRGGMIR
jgi:hypothetical protein